MGRACLRFGAIAVVAMSCWSGTPRDATIRNRAVVTERDLAGAYYCSIDDGGYKYPRFPCAVRKVEGRWILSKLAGSQRFRGELKPRGEGFTFEGELYCPWGDCTQTLRGVFEPTGSDSLRGTFDSASLIVTLERAPDASFGGASYGGDGYGGSGYGGWSSGGATSGSALEGRNR